MPGIGLLGLVAPQNAQLVAGKDPSGLLRALTLDSAGRLITTTADGAATVTGPASTAALALSGARWASVYFPLNGASGTMTQQYSVDGGVNWLTGPYVKRLDVVSANPAVTATITSASGTYEMPLPGNTTNVRLSGASGGTVTIAGGLPYVTGVPVTATLAEVTSVNVAYDSGTLELAGWSSVFVEGSAGVTPACTAFVAVIFLVARINSAIPIFFIHADCVPRSLNPLVTHAHGCTFPENAPHQSDGLTCGHWNTDIIYGVSSIEPRPS